MMLGLAKGRNYNLYKSLLQTKLLIVTLLFVFILYTSYSYIQLINFKLIRAFWFVTVYNKAFETQ